MAEKDKRAKEHGRKGKVTRSVKRSMKRKKKINMKRQKGKTFRIEKEKMKRLMKDLNGTKRRGGIIGKMKRGLKGGG